VNRDAKGRFAKGNKIGPGRKPGTAWSAWQSAGDWLTPDRLRRWLDKLDELACQGDVRSIGILLDRFLPARLGLEVTARAAGMTAVLPLDWKPAEPVSAVPEELWLEGESESGGQRTEVGGDVIEAEVV
jgi:hypothetical protein